MNCISLIALGVVLGGGVAFAQAKKPLTATEMQGLLGKGLVVNSMDMEGGKHFTGRVSLVAGGKLSGTLTVSGQQPIALAGTWQLKAAQLCRTLAPVEPSEVCETWLRIGPKEAVVQVGGKETSINRWQWRGEFRPPAPRRGEADYARLFCSAMRKRAGAGAHAPALPGLDAGIAGSVRGRGAIEARYRRAASPSAAPSTFASARALAGQG